MVSQFTRRQWLTLIVISISDFANAICVSLQAPFYPQEVSHLILIYNQSLNIKNERQYIEKKLIASIIHWLNVKKILTDVDILIKLRIIIYIINKIYMNINILIRAKYIYYYIVRLIYQWYIYETIICQSDYECIDTYSKFIINKHLRHHDFAVISFNNYHLIVCIRLIKFADID